MFRIDTHVHLLPSKISSPNWGEIESTFQFARTIGLDAICITEHRDALAWDELMEGIFLSDRVSCDKISPDLVRIPNGLWVSAGAEVAVAGGGDVGVHAPLDVLAAIPQKRGSLTSRDLHQVVRNQAPDALTVAHHLLWKGKWQEDLEEFDAIELPAKHSSEASSYEDIASSKDKPIISSSDAHTWVSLGSGYTECDEIHGDFNLKNLKNRVLAGGVRTVVSPEAGGFIARSNHYRAFLQRRGSL